MTIIPKRKYRMLIEEVKKTRDEIRKLEEKTDEKMICLAKKVIREPERLSKELDDLDNIKEYVKKIME